MTERRKSPRAKCRFLCTVETGRQRYRARVLDASESGICLLSPAPLSREANALQIDIPGNPPVEVEAATWHQRLVRGRASESAWCIGMILTKVGDGYETLLPGTEAGVLRGLRTNTRDSSDSAVDVDDGLSASLDLDVFHVCVESPDGSSERVLTIGAVSAAEAGLLARAGLEGDWTIVWVREA